MAVRPSGGALRTPGEHLRQGSEPTDLLVRSPSFQGPGSGPLQCPVGPLEAPHDQVPGKLCA